MLRQGALALRGRMLEGRVVSGESQFSSSSPPESQFKSSSPLECQFKSSSPPECQSRPTVALSPTGSPSPWPVSSRRTLHRGQEGEADLEKMMPNGRRLKTKFPSIALIWLHVCRFRRESQEIWEKIRPEEKPDQEGTKGQIIK